MASQITPNSINQNYPVAGVDNNSQGFRDNFTSIKNNFIVATREINDLLDKVVVKSPLTYGGSPTATNNDFGNAEIISAAFRACSLSTRDLGDESSTGTVQISHAEGSWQQLQLSGAGAETTLSFGNWPASGQQAQLLLHLTVSDASHVLLLDNSSTVFSNTQRVPGFDIANHSIRFARTGVYELLFSTVDAGNTVQVQLIQGQNSVVSNANTVVISNSTPESTELSFVALGNVVYDFTAQIYHTVSGNILQGFGVSANAGTVVYTVEQQTASDSAFATSTVSGTNLVSTAEVTSDAGVRTTRITGSVLHTEAQTVHISANVNTGNLEISSLSSVQFQARS